MRSLIIHFPDGTTSQPISSFREIGPKLKEYLNSNCSIECPSTGKIFKPSLKYIQFASEMSIDAYEAQSIKEWCPRPLWPPYNTLLRLYRLPLKPQLQNNINFFHIMQLARHKYIENIQNWELTTKGKEYLENNKALPVTKYSVPFEDLCRVLAFLHTDKWGSVNILNYNINIGKRNSGLLAASTLVTAGPLTVIELYLLFDRFTYHGFLDEWLENQFKITERGLQVVKKYLKPLVKQYILSECDINVEFDKFFKFIIDLVPKKHWAAYLPQIKSSKVLNIKRLMSGSS